MTVITSILYAMHTCRRVDPRHIRNILGKLKIEDPQAYKHMMENFNKNMFSKRDYEQAKKYFEGK